MIFYLFLTLNCICWTSDFLFEIYLFFHTMKNVGYFLFDSSGMIPDIIFKNKIGERQFLLVYQYWVRTFVSQDLLDLGPCDSTQRRWYTSIHNLRTSHENITWELIFCQRLFPSKFIISRHVSQKLESAHNKRISVRVETQFLKCRLQIQRK